MAGEDKLDKVMQRLDAMFKKCDDVMESHLMLQKRMTSIEERLTPKQQGPDDSTRVIPPQTTGAPDSFGNGTGLRPRTDAITDVVMRNKAAEYQGRADAAFQSWNLGMAPPHVFGEGLRAYRERLLLPLRVHSKAFADAELHAVVDEAAFTNMEKSIIDSAIEASTRTIEHGAPLRKVVKQTDHGKVTEFFGDPGVCWAPFGGGQAMFGKINTDFPKH